MSPGNERSRPAGNGTAYESLTINADSLTGRDVILAEIRALGPEQLYAASLGWRLGRLDAEEVAKRMISDAGRDVVSSPAWRRTAGKPRWAELQARRGECVAKHRLDRCTCRGGAR